MKDEEKGMVKTDYQLEQEREMVVNIGSEIDNAIDELSCADDERNYGVRGLEVAFDKLEEAERYIANAKGMIEELLADDPTDVD